MFVVLQVLRCGNRPKAPTNERKAMQNVLPRDMFTIGSFEGGVKCNGHVQLPKRTTKKDRKGCKKEKIETVLKNRLITSPKPRTPVLKLPKVNVKTKNQVIKSVDVEEINVTIDAVVNKPNVNEDDVPTPKEQSYNNLFPTLPLPAPAEKQVVENHLPAVPEVSPKKTVAKKRKTKDKVDKPGSSVNKKIEKIDPLFVNDKNQLSCNVITIPPKRKYAKLTNWQKDCGTRHETLQRILKECEKEAKLREDLYPLGMFIFSILLILLLLFLKM